MDTLEKQQVFSILYILLRMQERNSNSDRSDSFYLGRKRITAASGIVTVILRKCPRLFLITDGHGLRDQQK